MARGIVPAPDSLDSRPPDKAVPPPPAQPPELTDPTKISLRAPPPLERLQQSANRIAQPDSTSTSQESSKEDSGGLGNESDDEADDGEGGSDEARGRGKSSSDDQLPRLHHEMYPAALSPGIRFHQRLSSAEVEASSAGSDSSSWNGDFDDDDDVHMDSTDMFVKRRRRSLTGYRDSLTRASLEAPTRLRRIGALGISVHSDSDVDNPQVSGLDSADRMNEPGSGGDTSGGTRETDLGVSLTNLQAGTGSGSGSGDGSSGMKTMLHRRKRGVADAMFRGIVDELAVENRHLKDRLKRYEAHGVPVDLKKTRLFEIRFFNGLPTDKRLELEDFLTNYVQDFVDGTPTSPPPSQSADRASRPTLLPSPTHISPHPVPQPQSPIVPSSDRRSPRLRRASLDAPLAGPSNSGVEPPSVSGIGSGLYLRPGQQGPSASTAAPPPFRLVHPPAPAIRTSEDRIIATAVVQALEQLFRHSLHRPPNPDSTVSPFFPAKGVSDGTTSNEAYMANLLNHDFLSQGWVYLNLACTMAQIHRFSVTLNFVQQAVREYSDHLQVSDDGGRVRWIGARPSPPSEPLRPPEPMRPRHASSSDRSSLPSSAPREGKSSASLGPRATQVRSASTESTHSSSRDPSSGEMTNNHSLVPTESTAATSQHASTSHSNSKSNSHLASLDSNKSAQQPAKPVRPMAAVLQPMGRLSASPPEQTDSPLPHRSTSADAATLSLRLQAQQQQPSFTFSAPRELQRSTSIRTPHSSFTVRSAPPMRRPTTIFHRLARGQVLDELDANSMWPEVLPSHPDRAGTLIFYANGHFCSDLSKDGPEQIPEQDDFVLGVLDGKEDGPALGAVEAAQMQLDGLDEPKPSSIYFDDDADLLDMDVDAGLLTPEQESSSADSTGSSLLRLQASGMTTTIPADLFTVFVKARYPLKRSSSLSASLDLERFDSEEAVSSKRRRLEISAPKILSAKAVYHPPTTAKRDPIHLHPLSPSEMEHQLTRSNLAKHTQPSAPSPPSTRHNSFDRGRSGASGSNPSPDDDYLLSLSAPSHTWSPHERGIHSRRQSPATLPPAVGHGGFSARAGTVRRKKAAPPGPESLAASATGGGRGRSRTGGLSASTSDELPISLDEVVGRTTSS
ncbi:hypothetical protein JCM1840_007382 [Sporobolomyces johnsonii]